MNQVSIPRDITLRVSKVLDELIPSVIRDSRLFVLVPFKLLFRDKANIFLDFKQKAPYLSKSDYKKLYEEIDPYLISSKRSTSLNEKCLDAIMESVVGKSVLEVGCGNAHLLKKLQTKFSVTGVDILIDKTIAKKNRNIKFINAYAEDLPFKNKSYDTVICTHTLEHVQDFEKAVRELRRVTKKRLILVVPKQKPYRYTFDLHLRFFPYIEAFLLAMRDKQIPHRFECKDLDGDIFYYEDR